MRFKSPERPVEKTEQEPQTVINLTLDQLKELIGSVSKGASMDASVADAITQGIKQVRTPRPENDQAPMVSTLNPLGDRDNPRPGFKCEMWAGVIGDKDGRVIPFAKYEPHECSVYEQIALNVLSPGEKMIEMKDGSDMLVKIVGVHNQATQALEKLVIGVPQKHVMRKSDTKNAVPGIVSIAKQVTGHDFSPKALDLGTLKSLMDEHRKGNYVAQVPVNA